jgi:hypothetical protein
MHRHRYPQPPSLVELGLVAPEERPGARRRSGEELPRLKRFRFQLLARWVRETFPPCRVADIGGGKGLLSYLLRRDGYDAVVIDPVRQELPDRYRDLDTGERVRIPPDVTVPRITAPYQARLGERFDLLVALHAHGTNLAVLDTVARAGSSCVVLPCCVIEEPEVPPRDQNWFMWLVERAADLGLDPCLFYLNFHGQNVGFYVTNSGGSPRRLPPEPPHRVP